MKTLKTLYLKRFRLLIPLLFGAVIFLIPQVGLATPETTSGDPLNDVAKDFMALITIGFSFLNLLLYPLVSLIATLMDNEIIIGPEMESKLRMIWVTIRDWVNMLFVLGLVVIALYNVLGVAGDGSNYALKAILPKLVIGLVAVNFSFLAGKVLLDATAVVTTAVYALPTSLDQWDDERNILETKLCTLNQEGGVTGEGAEREVATANKRPVGKGSIMAILFCEDEPTTSSGETAYYSGKFNTFGLDFFDNFGAHNVTVALMVNMGQVTDVDLVAFAGAAPADQLAALSMKTLFGILMFLMFGFAYVAMIVVLLARVVILWICLALSPFVVLLFLFPDLSNVGGGEMNLKDQFFKHLFVPVVMGLVLSIGFTMLSVLNDSASGSWLGKIGDINFSDLGDTEQVREMANSYGKDISDFGDLLIAVAAIMIIWIGVFAAASQTIANSITSTIKGAGEATGKFLASTPLYATVVPIKNPNTGVNEPVGLLNLLQGIPAAARLVTQRREEGSRKVAESLVGTSPLQKKEASVLSTAQTGTKEEAKKAIRSLAESKGHESADWGKILGNTTVQDNLGLNALQKAALKEADGDTQKILSLLRKDQDGLRKAVMGEAAVEWGKKEITPEKKSDADKAAEVEQEKADKRQTVEKGRKALSEKTSDGKSPTTVGEVSRSGEVTSALHLDDAESRDLVKKELFNNSNESGLVQALNDYQEAVGLDKDDIKIDTTTGKIDANAFIETVSQHMPKKEEAAGATGATGATASAGAAAPAGAAAAGTVPSTTTTENPAVPAPSPAAPAPQPTQNPLPAGPPPPIAGDTTPPATP